MVGLRVETYKAFLSQGNVVNLLGFEAANNITDWYNAQARMKKCCGGHICSLPKWDIQDVWRLWPEEFQGRISLPAVIVWVFLFRIPGQILRKRLGVAGYLFNDLNSRLDLGLRPGSVVRLPKSIMFIFSILYN